jgi:hypothetical protein
MATNPSNGVQFDWTPEQLAILREVDKALALKEMTLTPGWGIFKNIVDKRLAQITDQHLSSRLDKEAYWASGVRLEGIREFIRSLWEGIDVALETLTDGPKIVKALEAAIVNPADLDGDLTLKTEN